MSSKFNQFEEELHTPGDMRMAQTQGGNIALLATFTDASQGHLLLETSCLMKVAFENSESTSWQGKISPAHVHAHFCPIRSGHVRDLNKGIRNPNFDMIMSICPWGKHKKVHLPARDLHCAPATV